MFAVIVLVCCLHANLASASSGSGDDVCYTEGLKPELFLGIKEMFEGELMRLRSLGDTKENPADSCQQIFELKPCHESGHYWINKRGGEPVKVHCDMDRRCCNSLSGWLRVAHVHMNHEHSWCPGQLQEVLSPKRLCQRTVTSGCSSAMFSTHGVEYSRVCGKVIGYQYGTTNAFGSGLEITSPRRRTINDPYIDGVSITYGNPRRHIWSFAAALDEVPERDDTEWICPCTNTTVTFLGRVPSYVGEEYYCETGSHMKVEYQYYMDDPLWNGHGCGRASTCCDQPGLPYFCKELLEPTSDDIELRLCLDQGRENEDVLLEVIELYVQ